MKKKSRFLLLVAPLALVMPGCNKPEPPQTEKMTVPRPTPSATSAATGRIVIAIGEGLSVQHEAQTGQTLEWRGTGPKTPDFWVQFGANSPCTNGARVLSGSATKVASCVAGGAAGGGLVTYSYYILAHPPVSDSQPGMVDDRISRCLGCNN